MFEQTIETSATPHITIDKCAGNLVVQGTEEQQIVLRLRNGDGDDVTLEREGETFTLTTPADCFLTCPLETRLTIHTVAGNLKIKGVAGTLAIDTVRGNSTLRAVGPVDFEQVLGNLDARRIAGDFKVRIVKGNARIREVEGSLSLGEVDGNARIYEVEGSLSLDRVGGNARVHGVEGSFSAGQISGNLVSGGLQGGLTAEQVRGNVRLSPPFVPGVTYRLNTSGNLKARFLPEASVSLALQVHGGVRSHIPGLTLEETDEGTKAILGAGEATLEAQVAGRVTLNLAESEAPEDIEFGFADDMEGFGLAIESRIAEAMSELEARLEEGLGHVDSEKLRIKMERATEKTLRTAERAADKVRRKAEQEAERARLRAERAERRWQRASGRKPRPRRETVTSEEQLRILRMVEEGKITPEQAADLLAALGGQ